MQQSVPSGAMAMHVRSVNPDIILRENDAVNLLYQFEARGLPKQRDVVSFGCSKSGTG